MAIIVLREFGEHETSPINLSSDVSEVIEVVKRQWLAIKWFHDKYSFHSFFIDLLNYG
jgi:hypothetical protein